MWNVLLASVTRTIGPAAASRSRMAASAGGSSAVAPIGTLSARSWKWQREPRPPPISYIGGASVRQRSSASPQRSAKMQPSITEPGAGSEPGIVASGARAAPDSAPGVASRRGIERSRPTV